MGVPPPERYHDPLEEMVRVRPVESVKARIDAECPRGFHFPSRSIDQLHRGAEVDVHQSLSRERVEELNLAPERRRDGP